MESNLQGNEITKQQVREAILTNAEKAEKALIIVYSHQTFEEKQSGITQKNNKIGFNANDAYLGTSFSQRIIAGRHLTDKQLLLTRKFLLKYSGQIAEAINTEQKARDTWNFQ